MKSMALRKDVVEHRFVHQETKQFNIEARRNKALANWAAGLLGLAEADTEAYRDAIIALALKNGDDTSLVERVSVDLAMAGVAVSRVDVRTRLDAFLFLAEATYNVP